MPKKVKSKKNLILKPVPPEKELKVKYFQPSVDKQLAIKEYSNQFMQWNSWQRRILLCQCTFQSSIQFLVSLSTIMEPVFHRDYQIHTMGTLIHSISLPGPKAKKEGQERDGIISNKKKEKLFLPITQQTNELYNVTDTLDEHKSPFKDILLDNMSSKELINHKHENHKNKDSITTIDFFWKYQADKLETLGNFVKVKKMQKPNKKENVAEYKQKSWYLPPINKGNSLLKASRVDLLKSFKDSTNEILASFRKWSHAEQGDFVLSLLGICMPEELIFFGNCIQQRLREIGDINRLPDSIFLKIFGYLPQTDLYNCSLTCKHWQSLAFHNKLWKSKCYELADHYNQYAVLQYLENSPSVMLWKDIYKELNKTVQQLLDNLMLRPPSVNNDHFENDEAESGSFYKMADSVIEENYKDFDDEEEEDEYNQMDENDDLSDSMASSFEKLEILHLSPSKSFATFIASESSKDSLEEPPPNSLVANNNNPNNAENQNGEKEQQDDVNDLAFDVRSKLVQPVNMMVIQHNILV